MFNLTNEENMKDKYEKCSEDIKTVLKKSIDSTLKIGRLLNDLKIQEKDKNKLSPKYLKMFDELPFNKATGDKFIKIYKDKGINKNKVYCPPYYNTLNDCLRDLSDKQWSTIIKKGLNPLTTGTKVKEWLEEMNPKKKEEEKKVQSTESSSEDKSSVEGNAKYIASNGNEKKTTEEKKKPSEQKVTQTSEKSETKSSTGTKVTQVEVDDFKLKKGTEFEEVFKIQMLPNNYRVAERCSFNDKIQKIEDYANKILGKEMEDNLIEIYSSCFPTLEEEKELSVVNG